MLSKSCYAIYASMVPTEESLAKAIVVLSGPAFSAYTICLRRSKMLLVDDRGGSDGLKAITQHLLKPLLAAGVPAEVTRLDSADLAFVGKGVNGVPLSIGIELKRLDASSTDLTQSLQSGRLSGDQLPKMIGPNGAYDLGFLVVEGNWRHDENGHITVYRGPKQGWAPIRGMSADTLEKRLLSLTLCGGLYLKETNSRRDTVRFITSLYHWACDRNLDEHGSHLNLHKPSVIMAVSDFRQAVAMWPGVGLKTSKAVEFEFRGSILAAASASVQQWAEMLVDGKRFGHVRAGKVVTFLKGEKP